MNGTHATAVRQGDPTTLDPQQAADAAPRGPVNWRSAGLGLLGVVFICGLTPFNTYIVNNTDLVGNHLPVGLVMFFLLFVLLINAPLRRWWPGRALSSGELAVALGMMLVSCTLPSVGLNRYLPGHLTRLWALAGDSAEYADILRTLDLPDWLFPTMADRDPLARARDPVITGYTQRIAVEQDTMLAHAAAVPWRAWLTPALAWGVLLVGLYGAMLCLSVILRRQWVENERLPFPLAGIYLSLIEPPRPGRLVNDLLGSRLFWGAFGVVFCAHGMNALHTYLPRYFPELPLGYDLWSLLANAPWSYTAWGFRQQTIYFTIVGIVFFLQSKVAFSLWAFYLLYQLARMVYGGYESEITGGMEVDQQFGAIVPFTIAILWVGRHHLRMVGAQMLRGARGDEPNGRYLPYAAAGWGLVFCTGLCIAWLHLAGATWVGAVVIVLLLMVVFLVLARIVAETGLLYVLVPVPLNRPFIFATQELSAGLATRTSLRTYFFASFFFGLFNHDTRESLSVYSTSALRVADEAAYESERNWRRAAPFFCCLVLALVVGYVVAGGSMLYNEYAHATSLDRGQGLPNDWGASGMPRAIAMDWTREYVPPRTGPVESHDRVGHFIFGAGLTTLLSVLRLRFDAWPLHPVGYLLAYTWGMHVTWFSIFLGWLLKTLVVRFGGASFYRQARPAFVGMIIGEAGAAAFWLTVSLVRVSMGLDYHAIRFLPQ
jgi:hypothetical protein